jgi:hypothetical protein
MSLLSIPVVFKEVFKNDVRHLYLNPSWTTQQMLETIIPIIATQLSVQEDEVEVIEVRTDINPAESGPALTKTQTKLKDLWTSELNVAFYVRKKNGLYPELNLNALRRHNGLTGECPVCMETTMVYLRHSCDHRLCSHCYTNCENNGYFICPLCRQA